MAVLKHRYTIRTFARTTLFIFAFNLKLKFQNVLDNERKPHKLRIYSPRKENSLKSAIAYINETKKKWTVSHFVIQKLLTSQPRSDVFLNYFPGKEQLQRISPSESPQR